MILHPKWVRQALRLHTYKVQNCDWAAKPNVAAQGCPALHLRCG
jgi:hypothetical protein